MQAIDDQTGAKSSTRFLLSRILKEGFRQEYRNTWEDFPFVLIQETKFIGNMLFTEPMLGAKKGCIMRNIITNFPLNGIGSITSSWRSISRSRIASPGGKNRWRGALSRPRFRRRGVLRSKRAWRRKARGQQASRNSFSRHFFVRLRLSSTRGSSISSLRRGLTTRISFLDPNRMVRSLFFAFNFSRKRGSLNVRRRCTWASTRCSLSTKRRNIGGGVIPWCLHRWLLHRSML